MCLVRFTLPGIPSEGVVYVCLTRIKNANTCSIDAQLKLNSRIFIFLVQYGSERQVAVLKITVKR